MQRLLEEDLRAASNRGALQTGGGDGCDEGGEVPREEAKRQAGPNGLQQLAASLVTHHARSDMARHGALFPGGSMQLQRQILQVLLSRKNQDGHCDFEARCRAKFPGLDPRSQAQ
jgi:hypothetical protein